MKRDRREYQRNYMRQWRADNPERNRTTARESKRRQRLQDPEKVRAYEREYRAKNAEKIEAVRLEYRKANRALESRRASEWYYKNRERAAKRIRAWLDANREKKVVYSQNTRARRKAAGKGGRLSTGLVEKLLRLQRGRCAACRGDLKSSGHHLDHVMPLALGGEHADTNIQLLCPPCNMRKQARHPVEFMQSRGFLL